MIDDQTRALSKFGCRFFYESKGYIGQEPKEARFYQKVIKYPGKFLIGIRVTISLLHGLSGTDAGKDLFWAKLLVIDRRRCDGGNRRRTRLVTYQMFSDIENLIAWLRSHHLEEAVRAMIVPDPQTPIPSPERSLARALFYFADRLEHCTPSLMEDVLARRNLRSWRKRDSEL